MFVLLRFSYAQVAEFGIVHSRWNPRTLETISVEDMDLIYESCSDKDSFISQKYAYFILEVENNDTVTCNKQKYSFENLNCFNEYKIYNDSCMVKDFFAETLRQGLKPSDKFDSLLKDSLTLFFKRVIRWEAKGFDSSSVWNKYNWILEKMGKNANDYVPQKLINRFIVELISKYELAQLQKIFKTHSISINLVCIQKYKQAQIDLERTIHIVKRQIATKKFISASHAHTFPIHIADTPCGNICVHVILKYGFYVILEMCRSLDDMHYTTIDISNQCQDLASNYFDET